MAHIPVTLFTSAVLGILSVVLSIMVSAARGKTKVMIGDGAGSPAAKPLFLAIRAHGNFIEYVPIALILLGCIEISGASRLTCEVFAALLIAARLMHAVGIHMPGTNLLRGGGAMVTWLVVLGLGAEALFLSL